MRALVAWVVLAVLIAVGAEASLEGSCEERLAAAEEVVERQERHIGAAEKELRSLRQEEKGPPQREPPGLRPHGRSGPVGVEASGAARSLQGGRKSGSSPTPALPSSAEDFRMDCDTEVWIQRPEDVARFGSLECLSVNQLYVRGPLLASLHGVGAGGSVVYLAIIETSLTTMEGLNFSSIDTLEVLGNWALRSFKGLSHLTKLTFLTVYDNWQLSSFEGLESVQHIGMGFMVYSNPALRSFVGLQSLSEVYGSLLVRNNPRLESFEGLESLTYIWGNTEIHSCPSLRSFQGLHNVQLTRSFAVRRLPQMETLGGMFEANADYLSTLREVKFDATAWPRCVTPAERAAFLGVTQAVPADLRLRPDWRGGAGRALQQQRVEGVWGGGGGGGRSREADTSTSWSSPQVLEMPEATWARWLDNGCGPKLIKCWRGMPCTAVLNYTGLVSLSNRTCGPCRGSRASFVAGELVSLDQLLAGREAGDYSVCRCMLDAPLSYGPVAQVALQGPLVDQFFRCTRGSACSLAIVGVGLQQGEEVTIKDDCQQLRRSYGSAFLGDDGRFHFPGNASGVAGLIPNQYRVCWSPSACGNASSGSCPQLDVGSLRILGPFVSSRKGQLMLGGQWRERNLGEGVSKHDRLLLLRGCGEPGPEVAFGDINASDSSMEFLVNLDPAVARVGRYHTCWCQPSSRTCASPQDFVVSTGTVLIVCPDDYEPTPDGTCRQCPRGRWKLDEGLGSCQLAWKYAGAVICSSVLFLLGAGLVVLAVRSPLWIEDVMFFNEKVMIRTVGLHLIFMHGRSDFPVHFRGTHHPLLESPLKPFRARRMCSEALQLLTSTGEPVEQPLDTSLGRVQLGWQAELWHRGWPLPVALMSPMFVIAAAVVHFEQECAVEHTAIGWGSALLLALLAKVFLRLRRKQSSLVKRTEGFRHVLLQKNPEPVMSEKGPSRAIQLGKLFDVLEYFRSYVKDRPAYYMDGNIFGPLTKPKRISYAELAGQSQVDWFVSHFWGHPFMDLCECLKKHAEAVSGSADMEPSSKTRCSRGAPGSWDQVAYWICFLSNNQHQIKDELGSSWEESSFFLTLQSGLCKGVCMVLDDSALPLTRAWCIFEVLQTLKLERTAGQGFQGLLLCTHGGVLNFGQGSVEVAIALTQRVAQLDLETASASCESDKAMIIEQVVKELGSFDRMNTFMRLKMHAILERARASADQSFEGLFTLLHSSLNAHDGFLQDSMPSVEDAPEQEHTQDVSFLPPVCAVHTEL